MPESYWNKRQEQKFLAGEKKVNEYYKGLERSFEQSKREIQKTINDFVMRYGVENESPSYASAMRKLNNTEIGDLQAFIDLANANMGKYNQELNNMSMKARITRYEALEKQIDAILQQLYAIDYQHKGEELLKDVYSDSYYQTWFNIDQYHGFHQEFAQINPLTIDELIKYPFDGANFSTRLWKQKDYMLQQLNESITTMLIQGKNPMTLSKDFSKKFNTKEYEAYRLLHTESSFIMEQGTLVGYKEDGVEKYQILATLDKKTSDICREADGEVYDVEKAVTGTNYPPLHPFCRSTTVPFYEDSDYSGDTRVARDPVTGKSYEVPADMTYSEWEKEYIEDNSKSTLHESTLGGKIKEGKRNKDIKLSKNVKDGMNDKESKNLENILNNAPESVQNLWNGIQDRLITVSKTSKDSYYQKGEGIYFNYSENTKFEEKYKGKSNFSAFFHEIGHNIDDLYGFEDTYTKVVKSKYTKKDILTEGRRWSFKSKEMGLEKSLRSEYEGLKTKYSVETMDELLQTIRKKANDNYAHGYNGVSDIISGLSKNEYDLGWGHTKKYWKDREDVEQVGREAFAHMFQSYTMQGESDKCMKEVFPKSYQLVTEFIETIGGR